ncbi:hypothetical protein, partial [Caballeronia sp. LZ043]|uniref:hypothetical protein n=1 Tax=Caballeronia sp. LZ043 TaxID=3038569 RepID=UPI0028597318
VHLVRYLEHLCFPFFGSSLYATCWKAKFQGKLTHRLPATGRIQTAKSRVCSGRRRQAHHHTGLNDRYRQRTQRKAGFVVSMRQNEFINPDASNQSKSNNDGNPVDCLLTFTQLLVLARFE